MTTTDEPDRAVRDALRLLEVDHLLLGIHERSFPGGDDDLGAGTPGSAAGRSFLGFVRGLGFTGVQLGPPGETSAGNPSPYDGTLFSRARLSVSVGGLGREGLLSSATLERMLARRPASPPDRTSFGWAHRAQREALGEAFAAFETGSGGQRLAGRFAAFKAAASPWLVRDALYEALRTERGETPWSSWDGDADLWSPRPGAETASEERRRRLIATHTRTIERYAFEQFVAHEQHRELRDFARGLGLALWGDLPIGFSERDAWAYHGLFLPDYRLGAPPSRTNPEGQPWGYPVLDPGQPAAVERFVAARLDKAFAEFDGVRVDHPHGYVCPWVYRADTADPVRSVQAGARLFASPDLPDHPALARFAIAGRAQMNPDARTPRWADDSVVALTPAQVERYDRLMAVIVAAARRQGAGAHSLACEILSTCPFPLRCVLERHGLGRFRVTQKADLDDPDDVYRSENAAPADWIMVGTHDTRPIWQLIDVWDRDGTLRARAEYLAWRLAPDDRERARLARELTAFPARLAQAQFADLFTSRARHVMIFFADAFGIRDAYNQGGVVAEDNWTLRLPPDYRRRYAERLAAGQALDLPRALAMALRARRVGAKDADRDLLGRLDALAVR